MLYSVNGRQPYSVLQRADEIKVKYEDREILLDFLEKIPDKRIVLSVYGVDANDWDLWKVYSEKFEDFMIALFDLDRWEEFNEHGIKWYWPYPITSFYELSTLIKLNPSQIMLGAPLTFDLERARDLTDIPFRMIPNVAALKYIPAAEKSHGVFGQWVRPEDVKIYEEYISVFEFDKVDLSQEELMLRVYKEDQHWPGNLNLLLQDFNVNVDNRGIEDKLAEKRINCKQRCLSGGACRLCEREILFVDFIRRELRNRREGKPSGINTGIDNN